MPDTADATRPATAPVSPARQALPSGKDGLVGRAALADRGTSVDPRPPVADQGQRRRHVLQLSRVGFIGGAERVLLTLAQGLVESERVSLIAPEGELLEAARSLGVETLAVPFNRMKARLGPREWLHYPLALRDGTRRVRDYCVREAVDVIHVHHPVGALYALPAVRSGGLSLVVHAHDGPPVNPLYRLALRASMSDVARYVCVSDAARTVLDRVGIAAERSVTIGNGIDWRFLSPVDPTPAVTGPGPHIGVFAVLEPRKGQDIFLEAAARVARNWPTAHFWLVGGSHLHEANRYVASLRALAATPALAGRVSFAGHRSDVASWLRAMDLVCLTSVSHESLGMSLLEAMALERSVVSSRIGVVEQFITEGRTGFLASIGDADSLADAMTRGLNADRRAIGRAASAFVRRAFGPRQFCDGIREVYADLAPTAPSWYGSS